MKTTRMQRLYVIVLSSAAVVWSGLNMAGAQQTETTPSTEQSVTVGEKPAPAQESQKRSDDLYDKGILLTVYGNDKAAIGQFKKVVKLDPQHHDAYFQLGVSYGELGQYETALNHINKAIELNSDKSVYYYGRGRIYLLSGDKEKDVELITAEIKTSIEQISVDIGRNDGQNHVKTVKPDVKSSAARESRFKKIAAKFGFEYF